MLSKRAQRYHDRKIKGLCTSCGETAIEGRTLCRRCSKLNFERSKRWRDKKKVEGKCVMCGGELAPLSVNYCIEHLQKNSNEVAKLRKNRKKKGVCSSCGRPIPEDREGFLTCGCEELRRIKRWN